jgi:D-threo-aldose 1-dehydrogenase
MAGNDLNNNLGFGCVSLTRHTFEKGAIRLLECAFERGVRHFDTAPLYGQGYSEKIVGKFIKSRRGDVTIATKFGLSPHSRRQIPVGLALPLHQLRNHFVKKQKIVSPTHPQPAPKLPYRKIEFVEVVQSFEKSCKSLNTDYIDYYFLHEGLPAFLDEKIVDFLMDKKEKGLIKKIGLATDPCNLIDLTESQMRNWDVLQYPLKTTSGGSEIQYAFPEKLHFHHSILKPLSFLDTGKTDIKSLCGALLALAIKCNSGGKVLFSTTKDFHLIENISVLKEMSSLTEIELQKIIMKCLS